MNEDLWLLKQGDSFENNRLLAVTNGLKFPSIFFPNEFILLMRVLIELIRNELSIED